MNVAEWEKLDVGERFVVEWQYRMAGGFMAALAEAMCRADEKNLIRLGAGFPEEMAAFWKFRTEPHWWPDLQRRLEMPI